MNQPSLPRLSLADMWAAVGDRPYALVNLARTLLVQQRDRRGSIDTYRRALSLAPDDPKLRAICEEYLSRNVAPWYFTMVQDHRRHRLYDAAFRRAISPGARVLDIGAGTGLFAMMAARAGASEVIACERDPVIADAARESVEKNGLGHIVRVVEADSRKLVVGEELAEPADVLIWDNLANNLIGVGAVDTLDDARQRLLKPDAILIPFAADIRAALARTTGFDKMGIVEGFDLSAFDGLRRPDTRGFRKVEHRSSAATLFTFDFASAEQPDEREAAVEVVTTGGDVNAIAQWITFHLHEDITYDTSEADVMAFGFEAYPVEPFAARPGAKVTIGGRHDRLTTWLWLQER